MQTTVARPPNAPATPAPLGSYHHIWKSCALGHLLRQTGLGPRTVLPWYWSHNKVPGSHLDTPSGSSEMGRGNHCHTHSREQVGSAQRGNQEVRPLSPQHVPSHAGRCPFLVQYRRQVLSSLDVPILWCLRRKIVPAVTLTVPCERLFSFDTCGLVSIIYHNTGEAPIKASSVFNSSHGQGDRWAATARVRLPRRQQRRHCVLSHSEVTSCFSAV